MEELISAVTITREKPKVTPKLLKSDLSRIFDIDIIEPEPLQALAHVEEDTLDTSEWLPSDMDDFDLFDSLPFEPSAQRSFQSVVPQKVLTTSTNNIPSIIQRTHSSNGENKPKPWIVTPVDDKTATVDKAKDEEPTNITLPTPAKKRVKVVAKPKPKTKVKKAPKFIELDDTNEDWLLISRQELRDLGLPLKTINKWAKEGLLEPGGQPNLYRLTPEAFLHIEPMLS